MTKLTKLLTLAIALCFLIAPSSSFAFTTAENDAKITSLSYSEIENNLRKEGTSEKDIENLIKKLKRGESWDSMNPKYNYVKPQIQTDTYSKTIYPDGSMIIYSIEKIEPKIATRSIRKINAYKVQLNGFAITMSFTIDARRDTKKNRAIIDAQYNKEIRVLGGTWTEDAYGYKKGWLPETNAWYAIYYKAPGTMGSKRLWCRAHVNGSKIWRESSSL